jgi:hypothetical protein
MLRSLRFPAAALVTALVACASGPEIDPPEKPKVGDEPGLLLTGGEKTGVAPLPPVVAARREKRPGAEIPALTGERDQALYVVGSRSVTKADLGDFILRYFPERAADALTQLVDEALIRLEADREQVLLTPAEVEQRTDAYLEERRRQVRIQYGKDVELEQVVRTRFGRDLEQYRKDAQRLAELALLRDRLVRLDQAREDGIEVRVLVFRERETAFEAARRLREGADMTRLAKRAGVRPPEAPPPFTRAEIQPPDLAERLFTAGAGGIPDPEPFEGVLEGEQHNRPGDRPRRRGEARRVPALAAARGAPVRRAQGGAGRRLTENDA